jgi:hypothetical protein
MNPAKHEDLGKRGHIKNQLLYVCLFCKESFGALIAKRAVLDFPLPNALKR